MTGKPAKGSWADRSGRAPNRRSASCARLISQTGKCVGTAANGAVNSSGRLLSTAGGVVFFGEDSGALMAADASTGKPLWSFQTSQALQASPMTYMFDNKQLVVSRPAQRTCFWFAGLRIVITAATPDL